MNSMETGIRLGVTAALLLSAGRLTAAAGDGAAGLAADREALSKWVETKCQISREEQDWRVGRELLNDRVELVRGEVKALCEKTEQARKDIGEADTQLAELTARNDKLKGATAGLGDSIAAYEARLRKLLAASPEPIRERVKPLSQRIPDNPAETKLSLSERFQNVIGIVNEMNKFGREVTVASEVRELADGSSTEVTVLYVGLGQAYYCNVRGGVAGVGRPGGDGLWGWEPYDAAAQAIADAVSVYQNERPAVYVPLPVRVK